MATQLFMRSDQAASSPAWATMSRGLKDNNLRGTAAWWDSIQLTAARGAAARDAISSTVAGPTAGLEVESVLGVCEWVSEPLSAAVTISGTVTLNLRAYENNMSANVAINCYCDRIDKTGAILSRVFTTARTIEVAITTEAANNFTVTPTSTNFLKGDRIRIVIFADDAGTMATGFLWSAVYGGPTAAASGDSYVTFTETFAFLTTAPAGSVLYLTDTASDVSNGNVTRKAFTTRGAAVTSIIVNTRAGPASPTQWTASAGGTIQEWFTPQLQAFTLTGLVAANIRAKVSGVAAFCGMRLEIAVCNSDGSSPVVWASHGYQKGGATSNDTGSAEYGSFINSSSEVVLPIVSMSGADVSVTQGQRLRIRLYIQDSTTAMVTGNTATLYYAGTSAAVSGDTYLTLTQTVTEYVPANVPRHPGIDHCNPGIL